MNNGKRVEDLENYGASLEMPKDAVKAQFRIMLKALRKKFGSWGMLGVFLDTYSIQRRLRRDFPETRRRATEIGKIIGKELFALSGMYLALAKRLGRTEAYEFLKYEVIYKLALTSMPLLYQVLITASLSSFGAVQRRIMRTLISRRWMSLLTV